MTKPNPEDEVQRLRKMYGSLADEELLKIAADADSLTDLARQALDEELRDRKVEVKPERRAKRSLDRNNDNELVTIAQYRDLHEALLAQGTVQSAGIECFIADDNMVRLDWFISNLLGGVKLRVRQEDAQAALAILEQDIPEDFDVEGIGQYQQPHCPKCQSLDISFEKYAKGAALTIAWVAAPIPIRREKWKCHSCGHDWQEAEEQNDER